MLLLPGSGPTDSNENNKEAQGNIYLLLITQALAENGYASLRYDKRSIGESRNLVKKESALTFDLAIGYVL